MTSGNNAIPTATVRLKCGEETRQEAACGEGPIEAIYKAIERLTGITAELKQYGIKAVTGGKDALGEVTVKIEVQERIYTGRGVSTDIIEASTRAFINAVNKVAWEKANYQTSPAGEGDLG